MIVHYLATYYSQWAHTNLAPRSQDQWHAFKFCRAVKTSRINGYLEFPWGTGPEVINGQNVGRARTIFGEYIADILKSSGLVNPILMPVPSKDGLTAATDFRSLQMLSESLVGNGTWQVSSSLRFLQLLQAANAGGPRGREALRPYLHLELPIPAGPIVLIDDIITTGGSLLASYDVLATAGRAPALAIVCGHTVSDSLLSAFGTHQMTIDPTPRPVVF